MANFNLADYETVEERHARALLQYPDLRCVIHNHTTPADRQQGVWVVEALVFLDWEDQAADLPKAVEWAFEVDGQPGANRTSALENACTSALGRALRWALGGSKGPSREEMQKVQRGVSPVIVPDGFQELVTGAENLDDLKALWEQAVAAGFHQQIQQIVENRKQVLTNG